MKGSKIMKERLKEILTTMDIPENRREINFGNLSWMIRNLAIRNGNHPDFEEARDLVRKLFKEMR